MHEDEQVCCPCMEGVFRRLETGVAWTLHQSCTTASGVLSQPAAEHHIHWYKVRARVLRVCTAPRFPFYDAWSLIETSTVSQCTCQIRTSWIDRSGVTKKTCVLDDMLDDGKVSALHA